VGRGHSLGEPIHEFHPQAHVASDLELAAHKGADRIQLASRDCQVSLPTVTVGLGASLPSVTWHLPSQY